MIQWVYTLWCVSLADHSWYFDMVVHYDCVVVWLHDQQWYWQGSYIMILCGEWADSLQIWWSHQPQVWTDQHEASRVTYVIDLVGECSRTLYHKECCKQVPKKNCTNTPLTHISVKLGVRNYNIPCGEFRRTHHSWGFSLGEGLPTHFSARALADSTLKPPSPDILGHDSSSLSSPSMVTTLHLWTLFVKSKN